MLLPSFIFVTAWLLVLPCLANFTKDATHELHRRGIRVVGSSGPGGVGGIRDLFLIDDKSFCDDRIGTLDAWVQEAAALHTGLDHGFRHADNGNMGSLIAHWTMFFGVQWDFKLNDWNDDDANHQILRVIRDHIDRVTRFLTGGGLTTPQNENEKPRLFCSGAAFEKQESGRAARDINGNDIVIARDDNTGLPTEYLTIDKAFSSQRNEGNNVFWVPAFHGYDFSRRDVICPPALPGGALVMGRTARAISSGRYQYFNGKEIVDYDMGKTNRHMILCPAAFTSAGGGHSLSSLSETVGSLYPSSFGSADSSKALDRMMTRSSTFYHELFHLTDNDDTLTGENENYRLDSIAKAVMNDGDQRIRLAHNPESYALLAQALHMYRNPPEGKRRVLYGVSFPMDPARFGHNEERWRVIAGLP